VFKILSLDGGGIRGAFIAAFLARIEQNLDRPLIDYFDLIAGTSTGGLIAVALGMGISAKEIAEFYQTDGPHIFARPPFRLPTWKRTIIRTGLRWAAPAIEADAEWLFRPKFDSVILRKAIQERMQQRLLGEARIRLAIPAVDLTTAKCVVFKTPHRPNFIRDRHFTACDVIMATTAAPSYFAPASIDVGSAYCDGGIWANNPAIVAYVEAIRISDDCKRPSIDPLFTSKDITLLSIGTGTRQYFSKLEGQDTGLRWWGPRLLGICGEAQSEGIHHQVKYLLGDRYTRIDFQIPEGNWALDSLDNLGELFHFGNHRAVEEFSTLRGKFFAEVGSGYSPFDA
jgi:patatin-like phospholipase/acyl hydrolase